MLVARIRAPPTVGNDFRRNFPSLHSSLHSSPRQEIRIDIIKWIGLMPRGALQHRGSLGVCCSSSKHFSRLRASVPSVGR